MQIAVASGKGGTGKTLLATSLALVAAKRYSTTLLDCDVEAPNAALYLRPAFGGMEPVTTPVPRIDPVLCTHCGRCAEVCQYNALAVLPDRVLVFDALCHGCGSCVRQCPAAAIHEEQAPLGAIAFGWAHGVRVGEGVLDIGQAMAPPLIHALRNEAAVDATTLTILDSPPGSSCSVVATLRGTDAVLLVTEPTPFGLHDLQLAAELARDVLHIPVAVVVNRDGIGTSAVDDYCSASDIPILLRIPLDRRIASTSAEGIPLVTAWPEYRAPLEGVLQSILHLAGGSS
ncbi:MAG: ATP-binding protein [Anaerolineae bacterium]